MELLYQNFCFFIIYAFVGWCTEVVFQASTKGKFINRGFLNGPVCPIYGFGMLLVLACLQPLSDNIIILFLGSVVLTTVLELFTGLILNKVFHDKWWDYSAEPFNFKGYVCLRFSLIWGLACLLIVKNIHPLTIRLVNWLPVNLGWGIVIAALAVMSVDLVLSVSASWQIRKRLLLMEQLQQHIRGLSDKIGETLTLGTIEAKDHWDEGKNELKSKLDESKAELEQAISKYQALAEAKSSAIQKRLLNAYPHLANRFNKEYFDRLIQNRFKTKTSK